MHLEKWPRCVMEVQCYLVSKRFSADYYGITFTLINCSCQLLLYVVLLYVICYMNMFLYSTAL